MNSSSECSTVTIEQLMHQLDQVKSERDELQDRLVRERNSKPVAYIKSTMKSQIPTNKKHKPRKPRVKQVSISSDHTHNSDDCDSAVYSPGSDNLIFDSLSTRSDSLASIKSTSGKTSPLLTTCKKSTVTTCSGTQTDHSGENLEKTNAILLRAYLETALKRLEKVENERNRLEQKFEEIEVDLALEKSKNINLQGQVECLSLENSDLVKKVEKYEKIEEEKMGQNIEQKIGQKFEQDFEQQFEQKIEQNENNEQIEVEPQRKCCSLDCIPIIEHIEILSESNSKRIEMQNELEISKNKVDDLEKHKQRLSDENLAFKMKQFDLTAKLLELGKNEKLENQRKSNLNPQSSTFYPGIPKDLVTNHIQHQKILLPPPPPIQNNVFHPVMMPMPTYNPYFLHNYIQK